MSSCLRGSIFTAKNSCLRGFILTFGVALAVCGWWYLRNWCLYDDVTGLRPMLAMVGRREAGFGLRDLLLAEGKWVFDSYWAVFGWFNLAAPLWVYIFYALLTVAGGSGLVLFLARALRRQRWGGLAAVGFLALWTLVVLVGLVCWSLTTGGSQGRLLYPAIGAVSPLLARGWEELLPRRRGAWPWVGIGAAMLTVAVFLPFGLIRPAYARPVPLRPDQVEAIIPHQADARFGESIRLIGYGVDREEVHPGETFRVTLCWQGEGWMEADYFVSLALQTWDGLTMAHKVTHPGLGAFPTSSWPPGMIFCDRYPLQVRDTVPTSTAAAVAVGWTTFTERLPVYNNGWRLGDTFHLPGPRVAVPEDGPPLNYDWDHRVVLVGYRLEQAVLAPGDELEITLYWRALRDCPNCVATVQVLREADKIGQSDIPLMPGDPGGIWTDGRRIPLWADAPPGVYEVRVAVYDAATMRNLPVYRGNALLPLEGMLPLWEVRIKGSE